MAFVPHTTFLPRTSVGRPQKHVRRNTIGKFQRATVRACSVKSVDAMEFFRHREGNWDSWRVTHHLAFRRSESGESKIKMECLESSDERIVSLCKDWEVDPAKSQGGCFVTWEATMAWDQEGENHEGSTVFALVPDDDNQRKGRILRDRGYAEIVPIAGTYFLDEHDALNLNTPYEGGEVVEKFAFDGPDVVNRMSTVRRFGGFSTATFATETRIHTSTEQQAETSKDVPDDLAVAALLNEIMLFSSQPDAKVIAQQQQKTETQFTGPGRWGVQANSGKPAPNSAFGSGFRRASSSNAAPRPSVRSAFGTGFSGSTDSSTPETGEASQGSDGFSKKTIDAAADAGIDLSKVPPSMREDFAASFDQYEKERS
ncbi:Chromophore lyase CpcS/CpeS 2 [Gracilariopsis chorda]|uniref:Chromophore lyase CpcS/CpeS 2 n=2 Tax=Gracilariopsis TaxID=2781 RepID=A0A2V3IP80_9FLOR|nr:Chromophore lyase CpcS/CpeS 2 [Gracilariopsis chorda]UHS16778.1 phycocyanobilin lyase CpcS [Gracilariopsis lemaneiformis]|eukprot:PXF43874.1 Chromophore lyase CpcS/CpeS 2 [Gracilariopsis chorda]